VGQLEGALELLDSYLSGRVVPGQIDLERGY
jgi:hypothetical protein